MRLPDASQVGNLSAYLRRHATVASSVSGERSWQVLDSVVAYSLERRIPAVQHGSKDCEIDGTLPWNNTEIFL